MSKIIKVSVTKKTIWWCVCVNFYIKMRRLVLFKRALYCSSWLKWSLSGWFLLKCCLTVVTLIPDNLLGKCNKVLLATFLRLENFRWLPTLLVKCRTSIKAPFLLKKKFPKLSTYKLLIHILVKSVMLETTNSVIIFQLLKWYPILKIPEHQKLKLLVSG